MNKDRHDTILNRLNEYLYLVSFNDQIQRTNSPLTDIHTQLSFGKEDLLINKGSIHLKEYVVDSYECRCHEQKNLEINNRQYLLDYKLEF